MKILLRFSILLLVLFSSAFPSRASHCAGGEIEYKWVSDSTYHVIFKFYRDCLGNTAPSNVPLCYKATGCNGAAYSITLLPIAKLSNGAANGSSVSTGCAGYPNSCQTPSSTMPGYAEWWFAGDVTLPFQCSEWVFSVSVADRNGNTNLTGGTNNLFYIEATLNSQLTPGNSSPVFTVKPVPFVCINSSYTYNNGASDPDGDSLGYDIIQPQKGNCSSGVIAIPFINSSYNLSNNPIAAGNTFTLNPVSGQMSFVPALLGASTLTLRVSEYRNGKVIGYTMRDIQIRTLTCNSVQPNITMDTLSLIGTQLVNGRVETCAGKPLSFCFKVKSPNVGTVLVASDNHASVTPGAKMTYVGQNTDSIYGCFYWVPTGADTGLKTFTVTVKDSTCLPPGIAVSQSFALPIYIRPITIVYKDTVICKGTSVALRATGGTAFSWSVLPGGSPLSSLSCISCSNPTATPASTTSYVVTSNLASSCSNRDTVTITVLALPATPTPQSNSPICRGAALQLSPGATATSYQWSGPAGFNSTQRNPTIANAQLPNSGTYTVIAKNGNCASAPGSVVVTVNNSLNAPKVTSNSPGCVGKDIELHASGSGSGVQYFWTGPGNFATSGADVVIPKVGFGQAGVYTVMATLSNNTCPSPNSSYTVVVDSLASADFGLSRTTVCQNDTVTIWYKGTGSSTDSFKWLFNYGVVQTGSGWGPYVLRLPKGDREQYIALTTGQGHCRDTVSQMISILPLPPSKIVAPHDACIDDIFSVDAPSMSVPLTYQWSFSDAKVLDGEERGPYHLQFSEPGYKAVSLTTDDGQCKSTTVATVFVHPHPTARIIFASQTAELCTSDSITLQAFVESSYTYRWTPAGFFENGNTSSTVAQVRATGMVVVEVTDSSGCKSRDSIMIQTKPCCEMYLPTAFTPNGDGRNDLFRILTVGHHFLINFNVINRWGQTVFANNNESVGWDGTAGGKPVEAGTYFYYVRYKCSDGQIYEQKGDLMLVR